MPTQSDRDVNTQDYLLQVSINQGGFWTTATKRYWYYSDPTVQAITPRLGPRTGNTLVTVSGQFRYTLANVPIDQLSLSCRFADTIDGFDGKVVPGSNFGKLASGEDKFECLSPTLQSLQVSASDVNFWISLNGKDFSPTKVTALPALVRLHVCARACAWVQMSAVSLLLNNFSG